MTIRWKVTITYICEHFTDLSPLLSLTVKMISVGKDGHDFLLDGDQRIRKFAS